MRGWLSGVLAEAAEARPRCVWGRNGLARGRSSSPEVLHGTECAISRPGTCHYAHGNAERSMFDQAVGLSATWRSLDAKITYRPEDAETYQRLHAVRLINA